MYSSSDDESSVSESSSSELIDSGISGDSDVSGAIESLDTGSAILLSEFLVCSSSVLTLSLWLASFFCPSPLLTGLAVLFTVDSCSRTVVSGKSVLAGLIIPESKSSI